MGSEPKSTEETFVLIVEDESRLRSILTEGVRECGYEAGGVRSGEDALQAMESRVADIAILDLNLPGMDGLQCFENLRERWPDLAVVILTGFGTLEAAQRAIRLGVVEFLTKPASLGDLERALHCAWRSLPAQAQADRVDEGATPSDNAVHADAGRRLEELEREWILAALDRHDGNREAAAAELGVSVRKLYYRLSEYQHRTDEESKPRHE